MSNRKTNWSEDETNELKRMWLAGFSMGQIGMAIGRTREMIAGKLFRLKLRFEGDMDTKLAEQIEARKESDRRIKELYESGESERRIAVSFGICRRTVNRSLQRSGIIKRRTINVGKARPHNGYNPLGGILRVRRERAILDQTNDNRAKSAILARAIARGEIEKRKEEFWLAASDAPSTVTLMDLQAHHCRWPIDSPDGAISGRVFCGCKRAHELTSYCQRHDNLAHVLPLPMRATIRYGLWIDRKTY